MKKVKRTKAQRINDALADLNKALAIEGPQIRIDLQSGIDAESEAGKEFMASIKTFILAYKKHYRTEKVEVELCM